MALSLITMFLMTFGIAAIGVGLGALYPNFNYENAAEIPTSFGGAVCMIFSIGFIAIAVMIVAWPIYILAMRTFHRGRIFLPEYTVIAPSLLDRASCHRRNSRRCLTRRHQALGTVEGINWRRSLWQYLAFRYPIPLRKRVSMRGITATADSEFDIAVSATI